MPSRADVNFLLTAVKAKFINADQAKQVYEAHQAAEKRGEEPLIHQTAIQLGLLNQVQTAKLQRMLVSVDQETGGGEGKEKKSKKKVTQIGDFKLLSKIGEGAMGVVYKGTHLTTGREVAIKVLLRKFQDDPKYLERFKREYTNAGRLNHPNIIEFVDAGQAPKDQGGYFYFAMEFVNGETLQEILDREGKMTEERAVGVGIAIGRALAHAHSLNIKHRDIKPDNIMVAQDGTVKLTDLGLAKEELDSSVTQAGMTIGTPHYMSPEQARGMDLDARSDIYSLGATLYHLLTGRPPFEGKSAAIVMMKHIEEQVPSPQETNPDISDDICVVLGKMLAKEPDDRYSDCSELVADLENVLGGVPPAGARVPSSKSSMRMPTLGKARVEEAEEESWEEVSPRAPAPAPAPAPAHRAPMAPPAAPQVSVTPPTAPAPQPMPEEAPHRRAAPRPAAAAGANPVVVAAMAGVIVVLLFLIIYLLLKKSGGG